MMKIKDLEPVANEFWIQKGTKTSTGKLRRSFFWLGLILIIPSLIYLGLVLYLYCCPLTPMSDSYWRTKSLRYPHPRDVSTKQTEFSFGGKTLRQDSTPLSNFEHQVLWLTGEDFKHMMPIELFFHFNRLGDGPNFSYNFQENYQSLKDAYFIRLATAGFVLFLGLLSFISSFFLPKRDVEVVGWSGTEWT